MTYITLFAAIITLGVIVSSFINLNSSKSIRAYESLSKTLRILSVIVGSGVLVYWTGSIFDSQNTEINSDGIVRIILLAIGVLAVGNLIYFATSKYASEKQRAEVAEFRLHLLEKGLTLEDIEKQYYDIIDLRDGRKSIAVEAKNWALDNHNKEDIKII